MKYLTQRKFSFTLRPEYGVAKNCHRVHVKYADKRKIYEGVIQWRKFGDTQDECAYVFTPKSQWKLMEWWQLSVISTVMYALHRNILVKKMNFQTIGDALKWAYSMNETLKEIPSDAA